MSDFGTYRGNEITIENFGITKSPLDAYRGRGKHSGITDNNAPLSIKQKEQKWAYIMDIAGNNVPVPLVEGIDYELLPTITKTAELSEKTKKELNRSISPCPCKSLECEMDFKKIQFETITLPHASGIHLFNLNK